MPQTSSEPNAIIRINARRSTRNPLIHFGSSPSLGDNINGPSLIRTPSWLPNPLGKYYLYFAHHGGQYIRLAYADDLHGPWQIYEPGVMPLEDASLFYAHLASPDVHIDNEPPQLRMYLHGVEPGTTNQRTILATSTDGIHFEAGNEYLGWSYLRVFHWEGAFYGVDVQGNLYRSEHAGHDWQIREETFMPPVAINDEFGPREASVRHSAFWLTGDTLVIFYSRKNDAPERILASTCHLSEDWQQWRISGPVEVLSPELDYEGVQHPNEPSVKGLGTGLRQLRDPAIFEEDGQVYLLYSIAGEEGIALTELDIELRPE